MNKSKYKNKIGKYCYSNNISKEEVDKSFFDKLFFMGPKNVICN